MFLTFHVPVVQADNTEELLVACGLTYNRRGSCFAADVDTTADLVKVAAVMKASHAVLDKMYAHSR